MVEINEDKIVVEEFGFANFLQAVQPYLNSGWTFDFETNEGYPQKFGEQFVATLVKGKVDLTPAPTTETASRRGRPVKAE